MGFDSQSSHFLHHPDTGGKTVSLKNLRNVKRDSAAKHLFCVVHFPNLIISEVITYINWQYSLNLDDNIWVHDYLYCNIDWALSWTASSHKKNAIFCQFAKACKIQFACENRIELWIRTRKRQLIWHSFF